MAAKAIQWGHDVLATDLARRLRDGGKFWTWENKAIGAWSGARPDVMAFPRWRYDTPQIHAYEIKVGRGDLLSDLNSDKWRKYLDHCQTVTFAMPHGLAKKEEIPAECGVMFRTGRGWRTERRAQNIGSACSIQAMAKLLSCHPSREPYPGLSRWEADEEARRCRDKFQREIGARFGQVLARIAADIAEGRDPAAKAQEKAKIIIADAQAEADNIRRHIKPVLDALGIPVGVGEWEIARHIREAAANLQADTRVRRVESALAAARRALDEVALPQTTPLDA